tara:strand:- start:300 stop:1040 length:741 start_codon:yes stop_codon:yes gene_type:complete
MKKNKIFATIIDNLKTLLFALIIAVILRSLFFQPFYIPSSSMEPTLLVGDRLFVSKYAYGYSKHSFPFSPGIYNKRVFSKEPKRGDLVVFKTPSDNRTDYIKRLIGLPGDTIQFVNGEIFLNSKKLLRKKIEKDLLVRCGNISFPINLFEETLPDGKTYEAAYSKIGTLLNSDKYTVPNDHLFFLGDNRDCSKDSRFLSEVGYVNKLNLVGQAKIIFFSNDTKSGSFLKFWNWKNSFRLERLFKRL